MEHRCPELPDASAYVLNQLDRTDRLRYRQHLAGCEECAREVQLLHSATIGHDVTRGASLVALAGAKAKDPRALSESLAGQESAGGGGQRAATMTREHARYLGHGMWDDGSIRPAPSRSRVEPKKRRRGVFQPVSKPVLGITLAVLLFAGVTAYMTHVAASVKFVRGQTAWSGAGIALQIRGSKGELLLDGIPVAPTEEHYEIWVLEQDRHTMSPAVVSVALNASGQAGINVAGKIGEYAAVLLYAEPDYSHAAPTIDSRPAAIVYVHPKAAKG